MWLVLHNFLHSFLQNFLRCIRRQAPNSLLLPSAARARMPVQMLACALWWAGGTARSAQGARPLSTTCTLCHVWWLS